MGLIDSGSKSSRLLASRRYTHNTFTTAQESFTNVLDLRAEEIYTRAHLIPSSSLPFSGSSQLGLTHSVKGQPVVKYWFRQQLTKSNTNNEVWFFTNPTGSGEGIGAQLIDDNQQTNFVSPKYSLSSLASATTEDSTPGYLAVLYKSTAVASSEETSSLGSGDIVSTNDYIFDYKTGVVQFLNSDKDPSDSEYVYMTAYQYVGDTLKSGIEIEGQVSASNLLVTDTLKAGTLISPEITLATASIEAITASVAEMKEFTNADTISGSFTALSGSVATRFDSRETDMTLATASIEAITSSISRLDSETETNDANITLATASIAAITASVSRIDSEIDTNAANITLATASIAAITASLGQPVNTDSDVTFGDITSTGTITAVEVHTTFVSSSIAVISGSNNFGDEVGDLHSFTGSIAVSSSLSVTGSTTIDGTLTVDEIGAFTAGGAIDFNDQNMTNVDIDSGDITGITFGTTTSAIITGSTTAVSSSIATRFDSRETDMTLATASIAAITASVAEMKEFTKATTISGSFTSVSSSIATRFDSREVDMTLATASIAAITSSISRIDSEIDTNAANITLATASIAALTASISRLNDEISTDDTDMNLATASIAAITASISELRTHETLSTASIEAITSSIAEMKEFTKATTISGSFTSLSGSIATRFDSREVDITLATASIAAITASVSRIDSEIDTNVANITLATASIAAITSSVAEMKEFTNADTISGSFTSVSSSIATRFDSRETDMTLATASIAALTASISRLNDEISTDDTDMNLATASIAAITASVAEMKEFTKATTISGSFTTVSSSIATRFDAREVDMTLATASIAAITSSIDEMKAFTSATVISGSTTALSSSIATRFDSRETDMTLATASIALNESNMTLATASIAALTASISRLNDEISTDDTDMNLATASIAAITASISRIDSEIDTNAANITLATASIAAITASLGQPVNTDSDVTFGDITSTGTITAVEVHTTFVSSSIAVISGSNNFGDDTSDHHSFTGSLSVSSSLSVTGSTTIDGTLTVDEIGAFTAGGAIDFGDQNMTNVDIDSGDITGVTFGTATSTTISGSTTAVSSSIATRFDSRETDMTLATASIAAITASVSRIDSEIDTNTTNITLATASIAAITSSISELKTSATLSTASIAAITASISRINDSLDETSGIFEQTGSFFRTHNDLQITGSLSVSGLLTGSFSGLEVGQKYKHVQTTPSSTWTVSHGFDYQYVNIDVYNGSDELVIPASVVATDSNTITISFNTPLSGVAIVSTGGQAVDELGKNVIFEQSTVSTNWRVTHSIGEQYPAVTVYDENDNVIIPERINAVDASKMDIIFTNAVSGNANISVGGGQLRNAITGSEQLSFDSFGDISGSVSSTGSFGRLEVVGNGNIDGNLTLGGNITIGDADSDSITINADLTSNLIPNADSTFDLGSTSKFWRNAYIDSITTTGNISGSVSSTGSFGNVNVSEMSITSVSIMSSSVATRFDSRETDMTLATASIAAITSSVSEMKEFTVASTISGSFTAVSSSIASRLDSLSGDVIALSIALG